MTNKQAQAVLDSASAKLQDASRLLDKLCYNLNDITPEARTAMLICREHCDNAALWSLINITDHRFSATPDVLATQRGIH